MFIKIQEFYKEELKAIHFIKRDKFYNVLAYLSANGYGNCTFKKDNEIYSISLNYTFYLSRFNKKDYKKEIEILNAMNNIRNDIKKIKIATDDILVNNYKDLTITN